MEQQKKYDVFISSKSEDYPIAREICRFLESKGYVVFFAEKSIPFGADSLFKKTIDSALDTARNMIVVCSNPEFLKEALAQFKTRGTAEKQIEHFKKELSKRDYKTIKAAQGVLSVAEADANRVECEELRGHIAEQEVIAAAAEENIVALREKYGAKSSSFDAITKKQLREAARKARERYITE